MIILLLLVRATQERMQVVWGPWLKLRKGPFLHILYIAVVNKNEINKRTEVIELLKHKILIKK